MGEDGSLVQEMISVSGLRGLSSIQLIGLLGLQKTSENGPSTLEKTSEKQQEMFSTGWVVTVAKFLMKSDTWPVKSKDILLDSSVISHIKSSMESTDSILTSRSLVNSLKSASLRQQKQLARLLTNSELLAML